VPEGFRVESISATGEQLLGLVQQILREGNARRVIIKQGDQTVVEFPLTIGVVGAALAPMLAAVGAAAALLTNCTIEVHRVEGGPGEGAAPGQPPSG